MDQLEYLPLQMSTAQSLQRLLSVVHSLSLSKDLQLEITAIQTPVQAAGAGAGVVLTSSGLSCCPPFCLELAASAPRINGATVRLYSLSCHLASDDLQTGRIRHLLSLR